mgnify:CR=1 FL=1
MSTPGVAAYGVTTLGIGTAALLTGDALADTAAMRWAEYVGGAAYLAMQLNYSYSIKKGNDRLDEALRNYYDRYMGDLLDWMRQAVNLLTLITLAVPLFIFSSGIMLLAYAPCINHGLKAKGGMGKSQAEEKKAVACGYWHLWRYNPALIEEGKNPFSLDSKEPNWADFHDLTSSSSVATRHSSSKLGSALAAPYVPDGRGSLPVCQEGIPQRGRGTLRRSSAHGTAPLQELCSQDSGELGGLIPYPIYIKGASECRMLLFLI